MAGKEDLILEKLDRIHDDLSEIKNDVVYLKTRDKQHQLEWPINQRRMLKLEEKIVDIEKDFVESNTNQFQLRQSVNSLSSGVVEIDKKLEEISQVKFPDIGMEITTLKTKASIWGSVWGAIFAFLTSAAIKIISMFSS